MKRSRKLILAALFGAIIVGVFWHTLGNDFISYDDGYLIQKNAKIHTFDPSIFWSYDPELYTPLTLFSYQLNAVFFGVTPLAFHLTTLLLHLACTFLVYLLFRRLQISTNTALLGSLLFALHPLQVETVAWASARKEVLSALFSLIAVLCWFRSSRAWDRWILLSLGAFLLALFSKVSAAVVPVLLLIFDVYKTGKLHIHDVATKWFYFLCSALFIGIAFFGKSADIILTPWQTLLLACRSSIFYISRFVVPLGLTIIHPASTQIQFFSRTYGASFLLAILLCIGFVFLYRRWRNSVLGILFFLAALLPSFFGYAKAGEIQFASEHYMYFPIIGLVSALLFAIDRSAVLRTIVFAWMCILAVVSYQRTLDWQNSETLYTRVLAVYPRSHVAANNLAVQYLEERKNDEALALLQQAVEWSPSYAHAYVNLSEALRRKGDYAGSMKASLRALELDPSVEAAYTNTNGKVENVDLAIKVYEARVESNPNDASAWWQLGVLYGQKEMYLEGVKAFQRSIALDPSRKEQSKELQQILEKLQ